VRQRSDSAYPLNSPDLGRVIGPHEEFEHGSLIAGCTALDAPPAGDSESAEPARVPARALTPPGTRNQNEPDEETPE
jgi:hypothetical protein